MSDYSTVLGLKGKMPSNQVAIKYGIPASTVRAWWQGLHQPGRLRVVFADKIKVVSEYLNLHCADSFITTTELKKATGLTRNQMSSITGFMQEYYIPYDNRYLWSTIVNVNKIKKAKEKDQ